MFGIMLYLRLIILVSLVSMLSPLPETRRPEQSEFVSKILSIPGELKVVIQKSRNVLTLYKGMTPVKSYWAVFGKGHSRGDKRRKGDKRTPEGEFYICTLNHSERFYKFMGISYPGLKHAEKGFRQGMITQSEYQEILKAHRERRQPPWETELGGAIGIHGRMLGAAVRPGARLENWTDGCIALNNEDVDEIYSVVSLGTPVIIMP